MRFLADESCDSAVVRALRDAGHDVLSVMKERPGVTDREVAEWAVAEERVLIAEDKDFGYLVHVSAVPSVGVVLLRYPASARSVMPTRVCDAVAKLGDRLRDAFVVIQPHRVRVTPGRG